MVAVQSLSPVDSFKSMDCSTPGFPVLHCLLELAQKLTSIESVMPPNHLILSHPYLLLLSVFPSMKVFSGELALCIISSVQFSSSVMSDSLLPHEPQHARPLCLSPTPRAHPNPCPLSHWCHPTISSSRPLLLLPSIFPSIRFSPEVQS